MNVIVDRNLNVDSDLNQQTEAAALPLSQCYSGTAAQSCLSAALPLLIVFQLYGCRYFFTSGTAATLYLPAFCQRRCRSFFHQKRHAAPIHMSLAGIPSVASFGVHAAAAANN